MCNFLLKRFKGDNFLIFVSGIHGVGKTYFCDRIKEKLNIQSYSASQLITAKRNEEFSANKFVSNIDDNQNLLVAAVEELRKQEKEFILDGHFCLLNETGKITRIPLNTYMVLRPDVIILLTEKSEIIADRRLRRYNVHQDVSEITAFQEEEKNYAKEIAEQLNISLMVSQGKDDLERIVNYIKRGIY